MPNFPHILNWWHLAQMYTVQPLTLQKSSHVPHAIQWTHNAQSCWPSMTDSVCQCRCILSSYSCYFLKQRIFRRHETYWFFFQNKSWQHILNSLPDLTELCFSSHPLGLHNFWDVDFSPLIVLQRHWDHHTQSQEDQQSFPRSEY